MYEMSLYQNHTSKENVNDIKTKGATTNIDQSYEYTTHDLKHEINKLQLPIDFQLYISLELEL